MPSTTSARQSHADQTPVYDTDDLRHTLAWRVRELFKYTYLLRNMVIRDLKVRYKNSVLGVLWSLLNPLGLMLVFTILFTVLGRGGSLRQYPVFILVALMPWTFFSSTLTAATNSVVSNSTLVKKVYFPRELLPLSTLLSNLINFLASVVLIVVFLYVFRLGLSINALWFPFILLTQLIFTFGLSLILSAIAVFYRDIMMILDVGMTAWFFLTPIFYSFEFYGTSATLLGITFNPARVMRWANPMASIIDSYRTVLWGTESSNGPVSMDPVFFLRTFITSVIILIIGYLIFIKTERMFGETL